MRLFLLLLLLPFSVPAQEACRAEDHYDKWIAFERESHKGLTYTGRGINDSAGGYCYASLVQGRHLFFDYLLIHATAPDFYKRLEAVKDPAHLRTTAVQLLQQDTLFSNTLNRLIACTIAGTKPKDTLDLEDVLDVAVKFFNIDGISKAGGYKSHVCVGLNGIKETMKKRNLPLEAFCINAIMGRYQSEEEDSLRNEFTANAQAMASVSLGTDSTAQLHRAQGAVYLLMWRSELLRRTLREAYEAQKAVLPFVCQ